MLGLIVISGAMLLFVLKDGLAEKYGLTGWAKNSKAMLWFLPLWFISCLNLLSGFRQDCPMPGEDGASRAVIKSQLNSRYSEDEIDGVLTDLDAREVVSVRSYLGDESQDKFSINVLLFQKWLLEN